MGVIFEIHPMVNAYELHVAGTLIPIEIPIVEIGGAPQMRGSGGCDSGFGQVLLRCLSESVLWRVQPPIWPGAIEMPIKIHNCTPARTQDNVLLRVLQTAVHRLADPPTVFAAVLWRREDRSRTFRRG